MIRTLRVRNLGVIEELELELGPGLNVLTGETGAGKSLLLGAIALLRGERVSSEVVRAGAGKATVEAILSLPGAGADGEEELLVFRSISREGRGRVMLDGQLATVAMLASRVGESIEVVSQGEHQRLLRPELQAELLDRYGGLEPAAKEVSRLHRRWRALDREIHERRASARERARRADQLRFEVEQIERAAPRTGELERLEAERRLLAHVDRLAADTAAVLEDLGAEEGADVRLARARQRLARASELDRELGSLAEALERALLEVREAIGALEQHAATLEADPDRLARVEARIGELGRLQERYGATEEEILAYAARARSELAELEGGEARVTELEAERAEAGEALAAAAAELGKERRRVGAELEAEVSAELAQLALPRASFEVRFEIRPLADAEGEPPAGPQGAERAFFRLAVNPGEGSRRLREAASGGELARLLLALRNVLRDTGAGGLLLFDEVDAGIGGGTARRVGERLRSLARRHQILCITHLPQIAALGETHYGVTKQVRAGRTRTRVRRLDAEERIEEIARLAGGGQITPAARAHARELLAS